MADDNIKINLLFQCVFVTVGIVGFIGNVLVCVTICYTRTLHNVTNFMILNLAIADALVSTCLPLQPFIHLDPVTTKSFNSTQCTSEIIVQENSIWTYYFFVSCFSAQSAMSLTLANFEHFIGITRPLQYPNYFTRQKDYSIFTCCLGYSTHGAFASYSFYDHPVPI